MSSTRFIVLEDTFKNSGQRCWVVVDTTFRSAWFCGKQIYPTHRSGRGNILGGKFWTRESALREADRRNAEPESRWNFPINGLSLLQAADAIVRELGF